MRNQPKPLSREDAAHAYFIKSLLREEHSYTLHYVKRDGSESESTGEVRFFNGRDGMDTMSVTLATPDKGNRTINLVGVFEVVPA
jgi:hypothetical protein